MAFRTENSLAFAPGMIVGDLDIGGMLICRDSGDYLPAEQIIRDPLHLEKFDGLNEDGLGGLRGWGLDCDGVTFAPYELQPGDDEVLEEDIDENQTPPHYANEEEELGELIRQQAEDMRAVVTNGRQTSCKQGLAAKQLSWEDQDASLPKRNRGRKPRNHIKYQRHVTLG